MNGRIEDLTGVVVTSEGGIKYKLVKQSGYGAQGVIYEEASGKYMVKFYYPTDSEIIDKDIFDRIKFIKNIQMPKNFVSVVDVIVSPYIGYVMEKITDHKPLNSYLIPDKNIPFPKWYNQGFGLYERIFIGYIIAKAFGELEKNNLSYCDISGNNILVKIANGASVKMIDVDNVYIAGKGKSSVLGTPRYIAPEVIKGQRNPDVLSDNYSLAVILFELLRVGHPYISDEVLDGSPEDEENALAGNVEYVTDDNSTNMLPADVVFTDKLKKLFERSFVNGKTNRLCRPSATEFEYALLEASNKLIKCPKCGSWHYPKRQNKVYEGCPWCDGESRPTAMLNFYDVLFDSSDYRTASKVVDKETGKPEKLVNTYFLKKSLRNYIKGIYVFRYDDLGNEKLSEINYLTIIFKENKFYIYNEFAKCGIVVKKYANKTFEEVGNGKTLLLNSGDEVYFEMSNGPISLECGGEKYSFIRMARFTEVNQ